MSENGFKGLIIGLGNPGHEYSLTPHNAGFLTVDQVLEFQKGCWTNLSSPVPRCELWRGVLFQAKWLAAKPLTYMNLSGEAVAPLARWYKITPEQLLVVHDELDLPLGTLRFKHGGGAAGHKGILSIASSLGTGMFHRLRIGIGRPAPGLPADGYVLRRFSADQHAAMETIVRRAAQAVLDFCALGPVKATQRLHSMRSDDFLNRTQPLDTLRSA